ncbi:GGDEF domain-containing protein [Desulfovibrio sp. OttesenSCG-928-G11]|nr:GGDEF domain-containing protein [Desulfovibrio sp. OttesenSCG-928-G11]
MLQKTTITSSWGIGLSLEQAALVRETLGDDHELYLYPALPADNREGRRDNGRYAAGAAPHVVWVSAHGDADLQKLPEALAHYCAPALIVMLLDENYDLDDIEYAFDNGISEIIRPPLSRERIIEVMRRALEMRALHSDMDAMTREIMLERELLERKNEILGFLVNFLTLTTENLEIEQLLATAFSGFGRLLPVRTIHAALWDNASATPEVDLYIASQKDGDSHEKWRATLLRHSALSLGGAFSIQGITPVNLEGRGGFDPEAMPGDGAMLALPLVCGKEQIGVLLLLIDVDKHLGRDQAMALDSAVRHFALTLNNLRRFRMMQEYADYDALTRVHSRRHFDSRLSEEMQRFTRYGEHFSMLMLDVDHFKNINDTYGHNVGDMVLRELGGILGDCVRNTDYCARFGGEEFVILLPHTGSAKATALADRIREAVAGHVFFADCARPFHVTVSIGVAHISPQTPKSARAMLQEADEALYQAKEEGRNRTCFFAESGPLTVAGNTMA